MSNLNCVRTYVSQFLVTVNATIPTINVSHCHRIHSSLSCPFVMWENSKWLGKNIVSSTGPITRQRHFRLVKVETNCRRHFKMHSK